MAKSKPKSGNAKAPVSSDKIMLGHGIAQDGSRKSTRLTYSGQASLLTIGTTRSGKGVGAIVPNLLMYGGSVICIDPKGENATLTALYRQRSMKQDLYVLDPWKITGPKPDSPAPQSRGGFNPLAEMATASEEEKIDLAEIVTDALVIKGGHDTHWDEEAYSLIRGLILHCLTTEPPEKQHLVTVRRYMTGVNDTDDEPLEFLTFLESVMRNNRACDGMVATAANEVVAKPPNERGSVISNANKHMRFLDNPRIREVCGNNPHTFTMADLKRKPTTVYVCLPNQQIGPMARWFRLIMNVAVNKLMEHNLGSVPVLLMADEFAALGHMESMQRAVAEAAGYGVRIWPFVQDLNQLKKHYGDNWQTFLANSGVIQVIGVNDHWTAEQISNRLGQKTVIVQRSSSGTSTDAHRGQSFTSGTTTGPEGVPLLRPEQIIGREKWSSIMMARGKKPVLTTLWPYWKDPAVGERWHNPYPEAKTMDELARLMKANG